MANYVERRFGETATHRREPSGGARLVEHWLHPAVLVVVVVLQEPENIFVVFVFGLFSLLVWWLWWWSSLSRC